MTDIKQPIKGTQTEARLLAIDVDVSAVSASATGTGGLNEGAGDCTILNSSGTFVITLNTAFARAPVVIGSVVADDSHMVAVKAKSASSISIIVEDEAGAAVTTSDFSIIVLGWDSATKY